MRATLAFFGVVVAATTSFSADLLDVITHPERYLGKDIDVVGVARVLDQFYLYSNVSDAASLNSSNALFIRRHPSQGITYGDLDRRWVCVQGVMTSRGFLIEKAEPLRDRPFPRIKATWVRGILNNATDQAVTVQLVGRPPGVEQGFVIQPHDVRETLISADERDILVLEDIGPQLMEGKVLARCTIHFGRLPKNYEYRPESYKRRLYFRITANRIEQVRASEGRNWKIGSPLL